MHMGAVHSNKMMQNATIYLFDYIAWQPKRNEKCRMTSENKMHKTVP